MITKSFHPTSVFILIIDYTALVENGKKRAETMLITFKDNSVKEYKPALSFTSNFDLESLYEEFIRADSVGKFWHKNIKKNINLDCKIIR